MKIFTETERLILREVVPEDEDAFFELDNDPEVHRYLGNKPVQDKEQTKEMIQSIRQQYLDHGIGRWAIEEKITNQFVGWAGLKFNTCVINNHINYYDLGYRLIRKYWGRGYASETAVASVAYGFDIMQLNKIYAAAHADNIGSNRIIIKTRFKFMNEFRLDGAMHNWYEISRKDWKHEK